MVHALKEAHRVLVPCGIMIDVRPLSLDIPLEIVYEGGSQSAGMIDMSPGIALDNEADQAIATVIADRNFVETKVEYFYYTYYWHTVEDMQEDIAENWQDEVVISEEVWQKARALFNLQQPKTRVRMASRMKLGVYNSYK